MAFISTKFDIGETVYWHDAVSDSVARGKVASITARHDGSGRRDVSYSLAICARTTAELPEDRLYRSASEAFPDLVEVAEAAA